MFVKILGGGLLLLAFGVFAIFIINTPSNDRIWEDEVARLTTAEITEESVVLKNVRNFTYGDKTITSKEWISKVVLNPDNIMRTWFVLEPFSNLEAIGHTFLTFEMDNGEAYSFSVEARKEKGEAYSAFLGMFEKYELAYTWGTERDFVSRRILYLDHPVYMYPLTLTKDESKELFLEIVRKTNDLAESPRFYNTVTANCTNVLAEIANDIKPKSIPYDISWNLPGLSAKFLISIGLIDSENAGFNLSIEREKVLDFAELPEVLFSSKLRTLSN